MKKSSSTIASLCAVAASLGTAASVHAAGVRGLDHVALTVPDMAQAKAFMTEGLGCTHVMDLGPFADPEGTWMTDTIGTDAKAVMNIGVMQCGNASSVELMAFDSPSQQDALPARDDVGASSLGFYVDDLEATVEAVRTAGGAVLGQITDVGEGPLAGRRFVYTVAPWGQQFFLMNDGDGIAYRDDADAVPLFSPADLPAL